MTHYIPNGIDKPDGNTRLKSHSGFTLTEMLVSLCILLPLMAGALSLFSVGVNQQSSEQSSAEATQDATAGFNLMKMEIAQAGSHDIYVETETTSTSYGNAVDPQSVPVSSTLGLHVGDSVDVIDPDFPEIVRITGLTGNTITGIFRYDHSGTTPIRLFGLPYVRGVLPTAGMTPNSDIPASSLC